MKQALVNRITPFGSEQTPFATLVVIFLACVFVLAACGGTPATSNPTSNNSPLKKGGTLNVGLTAEPTTLDPLTSISLYDLDVMYNIYDTLFKYDVNSVVHPELVSAYSYASPTVLNLTLRTGVTFHDGTPFNADAVIFNINRFMNDKASPRYTDVQNIASIVKTGDLQLQITTKKPFAPLLGVLAGNVGLMLSPAVVQALGSKLSNAPVGAGSGPFVFVEWIKGDHLLIKANPTYWKKDDKGNALPYLQTVRYRTITNGSVMYNNLETGQIQVATSIPPTQIEAAKNNPSLVYRQGVSPGFISIQLNTSVAPLDNIHVRKAIAWGVNRQEIVDKVLLGAGFVAQGPLSPSTWAYDKNFVGYSYDVNKAKAELALSKASNVSFTLLIVAGDPTTLQEAQFLQAELQSVGIKIDLKQEQFTAAVQDFQTLNYQGILIGWTGGLDPDTTMYPMFTSAGGFNFTKYANPQVDSLLESGRTTVDQSKRVTFYQQAAAIIVQDASRVFIDHQAVAQITSKTVQNYSLIPNQVLDFSSVSLSA